MKKSSPMICIGVGVLILCRCFGGTISVNSLDDSDAFEKEVDANEMTLRKAILIANSRPGDDEIEFATEGVIVLESALPALSDASGAISIDGGGRITIDGIGLAQGAGFEVVSANNVIRGMSVIRFPQDGIYMHGAGCVGNLVQDCLIGTDGENYLGNAYDGVAMYDGASMNMIEGTELGKCIISANLYGGILISGADCIGNSIMGCYIGMMKDGIHALPNGSNLEDGTVVSNAVFLDSARHTVVGGAGNKGNLVSSNHAYGILVLWAHEGYNAIQGNNFIWDQDFVNPFAWKSTVGVSFAQTGHNTFGGRGELGNIIDGYWSGSAIEFTGPTSQWNRVIGNVFPQPLMPITYTKYSAAVSFFDCGDYNEVGGPTLADGNLIMGRRAGVSILGKEDGVLVRNNSIFANEGPPIDYWNSFYPSKVSPPVISSVSPLQGQTCPCCLVQVYTDDADEARYPVSSFYANADGSFSVDLIEDLSASPGQFVSACATDEYSNTSAFVTGIAIPFGDAPNSSIPKVTKLTNTQCVPIFASGDTEQDWIINLSELLRVIQLYNGRDYACFPGTEDGYDPGPGDTSCVPHSADYMPQDWIISLDELLRVIQLYHADHYDRCDTGEDGFCPVFVNIFD